MDHDLRSVNLADLTPMEGQGPAEFCNTGLTTADQNHCAHFVSHALGIQYGTLCGSMKWATRGKGASMRVNDLFNNCTIRGEWPDLSTIPTPIAGMNAVLVFCTVSSNVMASGKTLVMGDNPRKHVGIHLGGSIWNFSNSQHKVVCDSADEFVKKFNRNYGAHNCFYYGYRVDI